MSWNKVTEYIPKEEVIVAESCIWEWLDEEMSKFNLRYRYFIAEAKKMKDDSGNEAWYWIGNDRSMKINPLDEWKSFEKLPEEENESCHHALQTYMNLDQRLLGCEFK